MSSKRQRKCSPEAGNKGKKTKVVKNDDQVRIVHRCESKYIVEVNNVLKDTHRILSKMSSKRQRKCSPEAGNKGKKTKVVKNDDQVRIVHRCESKYIVEVNNVLKDTHRKRIQATPFRWCLEVDNALEINCPLLIV
ncbi:hypothetical protein DEO72_LG1g2735 [Vigna unguiculata]|uniref:Uncharacterized protein n=1 Tax=Vigna unguiculata TaxID=3917 RepID=A0A4D6KM15_VIGUN|nr:hypothetical protein DEO72_LG1g2735 [Vigna unguiculata]